MTINFDEMSLPVGGAFTTDTVYGFERSWDAPNLPSHVFEAVCALKGLSYLSLDIAYLTTRQVEDFRLLARKFGFDRLRVLRLNYKHNAYRTAEVCEYILLLDVPNLRGLHLGTDGLLSHSVCRKFGRLTRLILEINRPLSCRILSPLASDGYTSGLNTYCPRLEYLAIYQMDPASYMEPLHTEVSIIRLLLPVCLPKNANYVT